MTVVEVFEPALCCATGVCGEDVDQGLVTFSADMDFVRSQGGTVRRYNLASEPLAFADSEPVKGFLQVVGSRGLPLVLVSDGLSNTICVAEHYARVEAASTVRRGRDHRVEVERGVSGAAVESHDVHFSIDRIWCNLQFHFAFDGPKQSSVKIFRWVPA